MLVVRLNLYCICNENKYVLHRSAKVLHAFRSVETGKVPCKPEKLRDGRGDGPDGAATGMEVTGVTVKAPLGT